MPTDITLIHIPRYVHASDPPLSISSLAAYLRFYDITTETLDLNLVWYQMVRSRFGLYEELDDWLMIKNEASELSEVGSRIFGNTVGQPFSEGSTAKPIHEPVDISTDMLSTEARELLDQIIQANVDAILATEPEVLGISLFSYNSLKYCQTLLNALRARGFAGDIVLGGPGTLPVREHLKAQVDLYVTSDGEITLLDYMRAGKGLHEVTPAGSLYPDYTGYPWGSYLSKNNSLRITGSKGCIRRCNFCDIYHQWPTFTARDGRDIANEMIYQHEVLPMHPVKFFFTDSLINGSPKNLRIMCERLNQHRQRTGVEFQWEGQFIATSERFWGKADFELMRDAGCTRVSFGIESGSHDVRIAMNKKTRDADIQFNIDQLHAVGIGQVWLIIVGFPSETREDFLKTLRLFHHNRLLNDIRPIQAGIGEFRPDQGTDWHVQNEHLLHWEPNGWVWDSNPENTPTERRLRVLLLERMLDKWGYIHRAQNSPFTGESSKVVTLNSLYYADGVPQELLEYRDQLLALAGSEFLQGDL